MEKLKVAILGAGGIGEFHARDFYNEGCEISAILTNSKESAVKNSEKLKTLYGIQAKPYWSLDELLLEELDAVSICTSPESHFEYTKKCLEKELHVLCEKPFVYKNPDSNYDFAKELIDFSISKQKHLSVNTQWVSLLEAIPKKPKKIESFYMYMEPPLRNKINLLGDVIPHMNSFLIKLVGLREIDHLLFEPSSKGIKINFNYGSCAVEYDIGINNERPRKLTFAINGTLFERLVDNSYNQYILSEGKTSKIKDPLTVSIKNFLEVIKQKNPPLINQSEILHNVKLQDFIIKNSFQKN